jgi:hypothetical protein
MPESVIVICKSVEESTEIQVRPESDTIWLSQKQMADLFEKNTDTIGLHLKNIFQTGELDEKSTIEEYSVVQKEGSRYTQVSSGDPERQTDPQQCDHPLAEALQTSPGAVHGWS